MIFEISAYFILFFVRPASIHVSGGCTFSSVGVVLLPVAFSGYPTLHSLDTANWTPIDLTNTLSLISLKFHSVFLGASHESLSSCAFRDSKGHTFTIKINSKRNLEYINIHVVKNYQSQPTGPHRLLSPIIMIMSHNLTDQFIHQRFVHATHQIVIKMSKLGIYNGLPKSILKLSHPFCACIFYKLPRLPRHPNVSTEHLYVVNRFHIYFSFFNKFSCQNNTSALTIVDATTSHLFAYPTRLNFLPLQHIKTFIRFY